MRKFKYSGLLRILVFCLFQFSLFIPIQTALSQNQDDDPDFIVTLALMAVADDRLDGVMDTSALSNLRAVVDEYYTQKNYMQLDEATGTALNAQRQLILTALDKKIENKKSLTHRAQVGLFVSMSGSTDEIYQRSPEIAGDPYDLFISALSSGYDPDPALKDMLQQRLAKGTQTASQANLDGHVAATIEGGDQVMDQSSEAVYDFSAGMDYNPQEPDEIVLLPLIFINMGGKDVRVIIEYYEPPVGLGSWAPSINLTVPGGSEVIKAGFPQGNYVFCADWLTDLDTDNDGLRDYDRAVIHGWVSSADLPDIQMGRDIYVNALHSSTPSGQCDGFKGEAPSTETVMKEVMMAESDPQQWVANAEPDESIAGNTGEESPTGDNTQGGETDEEDTQQSPGSDFWDQGDEGEEGAQPIIAPDQGTGTTIGLTAAEQANQGTHQYTMVCEAEGFSSETSSFHSIEFNSGGVLEGGGNFYARVSPGVYQNSYGTTITFYEGGYYIKSYFTETDSNGQTTTTETFCNATID